MTRESATNGLTALQRARLHENVILRKAISQLPSFSNGKDAVSRMERAFVNRTEAGRLLAEKLEKYADRE